MEEYRITLTTNIFINANSEEEAEEMFENMELIFKNDKILHDFDIIDSEITESID